LSFLKKNVDIFVQNDEKWDIFVGKWENVYIFVEIFPSLDEFSPFFSEK